MLASDAMAVTGSVAATTLSVSAVVKTAVAARLAPGYRSLLVRVFRIPPMVENAFSRNWASCEPCLTFARPDALSSQQSCDGFQIATYRRQMIA